MSKALGLGLLLILVIIQSTGQILWKLSMTEIGGFMNGVTLWTSIGRLLTHGRFLLGCAAYIFATLLWFYLLSRFEFSYIYPLTSLLLVASLAGSRLFLGETIRPDRWIAAGVICVGILLMLRT
jgi:hypothetical protein